MRTLILLIGAALTLSAQPATLITDGNAHGDPPYLLEGGWRPLLNGKDLTGWVGQDTAHAFTWFATPGVFYDAARAPRQLSGVKADGDRIINGGARPTVNLVTQQKFGDMELYIEWMVSQGSNSGVYLHGMYEVQVFDSYGKASPASSDAGGIYERWIDNKGVGGTPPRVNASRPPGEWQSFQIWFRAPRFDASGRKVENARFIRVLHNGVPVQEDVDLPGGTRSHMPISEAAENPLMLQGDHGPVAYRNIYWRPLRPITEP